GQQAANEVERARVNVGNYRMIAPLQPQPFGDELVELIQMTLERFIARIIPIDVKPDGERTRGRLIGVGGGNRRFDLRSVKRSFQSGARGFLFGPIYAKPWRLRTNVSCGGGRRHTAPGHVQPRRGGRNTGLTSTLNMKTSVNEATASASE